MTARGRGEKGGETEPKSDFFFKKKEREREQERGRGGEADFSKHLLNERCKAFKQRIKKTTRRSIKEYLNERGTKERAGDT